MHKSIWIALAVAMVIILAFVGGRFFYFGGTAANTYAPPDRPLSEVEFEAAAKSARLEAVDKPTLNHGTLVVDYAHDNALFIEELNVLLSKIVGRGLNYEIVTAPKEDDSEGVGLAEKLRYAKALILPLPRTEYSAEEVVEIERFVEKGGRILIIGDPTRTVAVNALNSIAGSFDIVYANDYLYSLENNDNNYRNVIYTNFNDSPVTTGLGEDGKIIFYAGGSIHAPGQEIILGDETTHSSISEGGRTMAAAALTTGDQVLAVGDLTFFTEPYSAIENNGTLINNIADFLTGGQRTYELADFPYFLNPNVDIVYDNSLVFNSQLEDSIKLKETLEQLDHKVTFKNEIGQENDVIFVGRFDETEVVGDYLAEAQITILGPDDKIEAEEVETEESDTDRLALISDETPGPEDRFVDGRIRVEGVGDLERGGSTLFSLRQEEGRNVMIILSDNPDTNADAFELLLNNELPSCVVDTNLAVCHTEEPGGEMRPSLRRTRIDNILIVSDNNGRERENPQTSMVAYNNVLSNTYRIDTWVISTQGSPDVDQLLEYDAVIWTTGNYWDDSIEEEDAVMLARYVELGGNLILSGASISFDWDHTEFLEKVAHADYLDFAEQKDLELVLPDHPIAKDFAEGSVITLTLTSAEQPLEPDVVRHTADARVIFQRGPESQQAGAASVIAYEDERVKVAYFAFPVYLLPPEQQALLINNTVDWFTKKPLDLPNEDDYKPFGENGQAEEETEEQPPDAGEGEQNGGGNGDQQNGEGDGNGSS